VASNDNLDVKISHSLNYVAVLQNIKELLDDGCVQSNSRLTRNENSASIEEKIRQIINDALTEEKPAMSAPDEQGSKNQVNATDTVSLPEAVRQLERTLLSEAHQNRFQEALNSLRSSYPVSTSRDGSLDPTLDSTDLANRAKDSANRIKPRYPSITR
jgi:hypothetical protein